MTYVLIDVGCLECGLPSNVLAVFDADSDDEARTIARTLRPQIKFSEPWKWDDPETVIYHTDGGDGDIQLHRAPERVAVP
jgi:hypothetical protein